MRLALKSPRILRTGSPLSLEAIRQVCPAVFAEHAHADRGPRYRYVPTITPLQEMLKSGWGVYEASQQRATKLKEKNNFTKHMLRMRKLTDFDRPAVVGDGIPEVILINSHDATSAYHLKAGFFTFVCSNGMMVGKSVTGFSVRHTVGPQTSEEVLAAGERIITESFPRMMERIDVYKSITLDMEKQYRLAKKAVDLRYPGGGLIPITPESVLKAQHKEQEDPTLWNILNRVQEGIIYGGMEARTPYSMRIGHVRPVERVSAVATINAGIWDEAEDIACDLGSHT